MKHDNPTVIMQDKKQIKCITCGRLVGEVENGAKVFFSQCSHCSDQKNKENEVFAYITDKFENAIRNVIVTV